MLSCSSTWSDNCFRKPKSLLEFVVIVCVVSLALLGATGCSWQYSLVASSNSESGLSITKQPENVTIPADQTATFSVAATGNVSPKYQWYKNGEALSGATSSSYTSPALPLSTSGSSYTVVVSDASQSIPSTPAVLTVTPLSPDLTLLPIQDQRIGTETSIQVSATSLSAGGIRFSVLSGPATINNSTLTVTGVGAIVIGAAQEASGEYSSATTTTSFNVMENVVISPITPENITMAPGSVVFSATVTGGATDSLIWKASGGIFAGNIWTSPNAVGAYQITAQSVDDPTKTVTTSVTVSEPVITQQPTGRQVCNQASVSLTVAAEYAVTYQWNLDGKPLNGANGPSYNIPSANSSLDVGQYTVTVANPAGSVVSVPAAVSIGSSITTNPTSLTVPNDQTANFSVAASGVAPFSYQWYLVPLGNTTGIPLSGAVQNSYTTPTLNGTFSGNQYYVVVQDACGQVLTSSAATLLVSGANAPPTIITEPIDQTVVPGATANLSVAASGTPTLSYQWYRIPAGSQIGVAISSATTPEYTIPSLSTLITNDRDEYYVIVTNPYGQATSTHAVLAVGAGIQITQQPSSAYIQVGGSATYSVTATSSLPLTYQWYEAVPGSAEFHAVSGATAATYTLTGATAVESGSDLYVVVSNGITSSVQSNTAALFVGPLVSATSCSWDMIGTAKLLDNCSYQMTAPETWQGGEIVWPELISTDNLQLSFTVTLSNTSPFPADGFAVVLGDPSLGATLTSVGIDGEGLGARGIPGLVLAFDDYYNDDPTQWPIDPKVPYLGVGRGENNLWESPYTNVNSTIPALVAYGQSVSHSYVLTLFKGYMTMLMDGQQVFSGIVSVPPVAYLYATSSTGLYWEQTVISNISAVVETP